VSGKSSTETFDAVLLCSGHHADKNMPHFEGEEEFQGKRMHTHEYRDHKGYEGKRIVVIGFGNSGGDIAVELGKFGSQVRIQVYQFDCVCNLKLCLFYCSFYFSTES